jgi:triacylglycerol esterase/lipase EstA (alpha/beta hydrolase family)
VGDGALTAGAVLGTHLGRAVVSAGEAAVSAYRAIDPDARRHLAELPLMGLTMLVPRTQVLSALPDDHHRPLLFVHGLAGHRGNFAPMRQWFALCGRTRSYSLSLTGDVDSMADALRAAIAEVLAVNALPEGTQVDLVAHSLGGLVSRVALLDAATAARVATLVTLGTPHRGTHAARFAGTPLMTQLRPGSDVLQRIDAQCPWVGAPTLPRLVALWSDADMLLLPASTARVEGAQNIELQGLTHFEYLLHPRAWSTVLTALSMMGNGA